MKDLYNENYKNLMKEIEEDTHTHQKTPYNHGLEELILLTRPFYLKTKKNLM